jgi:menaquinone-9 beta-reductase
LDACAAVQEVRAVTDRRAAARFLERHGARPGETLSWVGIDGGFSALNVALNSDLTRVSLLCGTVADNRHHPATEHLARFRAREGWLGKRELRGVGVIPLGGLCPRLAVPGVALIGDAAGQVFSAHASGTGFGLIAAHLLAETLAKGSDPGDPAIARGYERAFRREYGPTLAIADAVRRSIQLLSGEDLAALLGAGLLPPALVEAGLAHRLPALSLCEIPGLLRGAGRFLWALLLGKRSGA